MTFREKGGKSLASPSQLFLRSGRPKIVRTRAGPVRRRSLGQAPSRRVHRVEATRTIPAREESPVQSTKIRLKTGVWGPAGSVGRLSRAVHASWTARESRPTNSGFHTDFGLNDSPPRAWPTLLAAAETKTVRGRVRCDLPENRPPTSSKLRLRAFTGNPPRFGRPPPGCRGPSPPPATPP
jgi:hypothetical protein